MTPSERKVYQSYIKETLKQRDYLVSAEEKGKVDGKAEEKIEMAKKMLIKKRSIEEMDEFTELPIDEIKKLKR